MNPATIPSPGFGHGPPHRRWLLRWFAAGLLGRALASNESARAAVVSRLRVPICDDFGLCGFGNECPPPLDVVKEDVLGLKGKIHIVARAMVDAAGGAHVGMHLDFQRVTGVGSVSGERYVVTGASNSVEQDLDEAPGEFTFTQALILNREGSADNFKVFVTFHVTVNANGEVTATVDEVRRECRG